MDLTFIKEGLLCEPAPLVLAVLALVWLCLSYTAYSAEHLSLCVATFLVAVACLETARREFND